MRSFILYLLSGIFLLYFYFILSYVVILALVSAAHADSFHEINTGGITYHLFVSKQYSSRFSNQLGADGNLIATPTLGYTRAKEELGEFETYTFFSAINSIGEPAGGFLLETGDIIGNYHLGVAFGGYLQDDQAFRDRGIAPFTTFEVGNIGLIPLVGLVLNYKIPLTKSTYLKVNNLISPVMTNHLLSYGWNF